MKKRVIYGLANMSYCEGPQTQGTGSTESKMPLDKIKSSMRNSWKCNHPSMSKESWSDGPSSDNDWLILFCHR